MNGNFYQSPTFSSNPTFPANNEIINIPNTPPSNIPVESIMSYEQNNIENILKINKGRRVKAYVSFPNSSEWQNKVFSGVIEDANIDHLIISDPSTGNWYLIKIIYLDYLEFMEKINCLEQKYN